MLRWVLILALAFSFAACDACDGCESASKAEIAKIKRQAEQKYNCPVDKISVISNDDLSLRSTGKITKVMLLVCHRLKVVYHCKRTSGCKRTRGPCWVNGVTDLRMKETPKPPKPSIEDE